MNKLFLNLLLVSFLFGTPTFASLLKLPHKAFKLPNGLKVFMVKYPSPGVLAYQLAVHVGSRNEVEEGKTGFAHFFEHLMFRGTKNRTGKEFGELYARLGNENNAWTSNDMTCYHGVVANRHVDTVLEAEADRFANLDFEEKLLRDEAGAVLGEYNKNASQPEFVLEEKLSELAFQKHPYSHTTMGYKEDILDYPNRYKDVWPFFKRYYKPSNVRLILVGDLEFSKTQKLVTRLFKGWKDPVLDPEKYPKIKIPQEPTQTEARQAQVKLDKPTQTRIWIAYKVPAFSTKTTEHAALTLLAESFFSVTSDFQKEFRFSKKWVDSVSANAPESVDPGLWTIQLRLSEAGLSKEKELIRAVEKTIQKIRNKPIDKKQLAQTKQRFNNFAITGLFSRPDSLASAIAFYTNFEPDFEVLERMFKQIKNTSSAQIQKFAKKHLVDAHKTTVILRGSE